MVELATSPSELLTTLAAWRGEGRRTAMATVVSTWGSAPCRPGSVLIIDDRQRFMGSVSGGCVEGAVVTSAAEVMASGSGAPCMLEFGVADDQAWEVGLACGGRIQVYLEALGDGAVNGDRDTGSPGPLLEPLLGAVNDARPVVRVVALDDGRQRLFYPAEPGDQGLAASRAAAARAAAAADRSALYTDDTNEDGADADVFLQVLNPPLRMLVVGAVHITQALAPLAALSHYRVTVIDPRRAFAAPARFPGIRVCTDWPQEAAPLKDIDSRTAFVTLSHDPKIDDPALLLALNSPAFYIGALGSRKTHAARLQRLASAGCDEAQLARIHAPVGLALGATSPAEIALAVMAEVTSVLRGGKA